MTTLALASLGVLYASGVLRLRWAGAIIVGARGIASFYVGLMVLGLASSPAVEARAEHELSAHMAQHLVLWIVAPPLLIWGRPLLVAALALPTPARRLAMAIGRRLRPALHPVVVWGLSAATLWGWHLPRLYDAAVRSSGLHTAEHASFLAAAILLWAVVLPGAAGRRLNRGPSILLVFATMLQSAWLAMVIALTDRVIYPVYAAGVDPSSALADQNLAGVVMWVPMTIVHAAVIALLLRRWLGELEVRARHREAGDVARPSLAPP